MGKLETQVIVNLEGGEGNQLFQWAFGRSVGLARGEEVLWCKKRFETDPKRCYSLDPWAFSDSMKFVDTLEEPIYTEPVFQFDPSVYTTGARSFTGHRQTEKYFNHEVVRREMKLRERPSDESLALADRIRAHEHSVFLHIRRTDNLEPAGISFHGLMGMDYWVESLRYIRERYEGLKVFVFSDDPEWCKSQFPYVVVDHNKMGDSEHVGKENEDIWLMSLCRHAIIANSSFSWWGAWLGDTRRDRIVICPQRWFAEPKMESKDICPERWIRI